MGSSAGIWGGAVMDTRGSYAGERGLARRGLDAGDCEERRREGEPGCAATPWSAWAEKGTVVDVVDGSERLGCWAWPFSRDCGERLLLAVL
jgi:hypothetical protein